MGLVHSAERLLIGALTCSAVLGAGVARAEHAQVRLLLDGTQERESLAAALRQQLAGRATQVVTADPPAGDNRAQRACTAQRELERDLPATALWIETESPGQRSLFAVSGGGRIRSAPLLPASSDLATQRAFSIVAASLLEDLTRFGEAVQRCDEPGREVALASHDAFADREKPPIMRRAADARERQSSVATGLSPWIAFVGLGAASALAATAYLSAHESTPPRDQAPAEPQTIWGVAGTTPPSQASRSPSATPASPDRTAAYALGASAAGVAVASLAVALFFTDWGGKQEDAHVRVSVAPDRASIDVAGAL